MRPYQIRMKPVQVLYRPDKSSCGHMSRSLMNQERPHIWSQKAVYGPDPASYGHKQASYDHDKVSNGPKEASYGSKNVSYQRKNISY